MPGAEGLPALAHFGGRERGTVASGFEAMAGEEFRQGGEVLDGPRRRAQVPQADSLVAGGRQEKPGVGAEVDLDHRVGVAERGGEGLAIHRVPDAGRAVAAGGGEEAAVPAERDRFDEALVTNGKLTRYIAEISPLDRLWRAIDISKAQLDRCRHVMLPRQGQGEATLEQHRSIIRALNSKDPERARRAMSEHLEAAFSSTLKVIESGEIESR